MVEEHHLIMNIWRDVCKFCAEAGRVEHPGIRNGDQSSGPQYKYLVANF